MNTNINLRYFALISNLIDNMSVFKWGIYNILTAYPVLNNLYQNTFHKSYKACSDG